MEGCMELMNFCFYCVMNSHEIGPPEDHQGKSGTKCIHESIGPILYLAFCPKMRLRTFLQNFALYFRCSKAKHCKNVV